jgi:ribosomal protein S18 acetylase RimI-like enzyme
VKFRRATPDDLPALLDLQERFYAGEGYPYDRGKMERGMRELLGDESLGRLFIARDAYLVLGFGFSLEFGGRDAFVDELYVAGESRGQGLGTRALQLAEDACREAGIHALHLEVEHGNVRARALYERSGYQAHDRHLMTKRF